MASRELLSSLLRFYEDLYREKLIEPSTVNYSAWGTREEFVTRMAISVSLMITTSCGRDFIEADTIPPTYSAEMASLRSLTFHELLEQREFALKKPMSEVNWRQIVKLFPAAQVIFVVCLRDPYETYKSLMRLGWISGISDFADMAEASFHATKELLDTDQLVLADVALDSGEPAIADLAWRLGNTSLGSLDDGKHVEAFWMNASPTAVGPTSDKLEFMSDFQKRPANALYQALRERLPRSGPALQE